MITQRIRHNTTAYQEMISLRLSVLLQPLGIGINFIRQEEEAADVLIGGYESGLLVACCILTEIGKGKVQLRQMAVKPEHQGKKVGAAVLLFAEDEAAREGYDEVVLHARDVVMPFYEKNGYIAAEPGFMEVGIPHHIMSKKLENR